MPVVRSELRMDFEDAEVHPVIRTMSELRHHQLLRGRAAGLGDIDIVDLFAFLQTDPYLPCAGSPSMLV